MPKKKIEISLDEIYKSGGLLERTRAEIERIGAREAAGKCDRSTQAINYWMKAKFPETSIILKYAEKLGVE